MKCDCDWPEHKKLVKYQLGKIDELANAVLVSKRYVWTIGIALVTVLLIAVPSIIALIQLFQKR